MRYDRAKELRAKLAADIAALTAPAEAADAADHDPQALPGELARREALEAKLDAACQRLEAEAQAEAAAALPAYEAKKAAYDAKKGRRGRPPKPPDDAPPPERQSNQTDPDSALNAKNLYKRRKQNSRTRVRHHQERNGVRPLPPARHENVAAECALIALAYNCRRLHRL